MQFVKSTSMHHRVGLPARSKYTGSCFNIRLNVLLQDLAKSRSREIGDLNYRIAMKFGGHVGSTAADVPVEFQSDRVILKTKLADSKHCEMLW